MGLAYIDEGIFLSLLMSFAGAMFGLLASMLIALPFYIHDEGKTYTLDAVSLRSIQDNTKTQGSFFLGSGTINGVPQYSWYQETSPNTFERFDAPASEARIHYTEGTPHYTKVIKKNDHPFVGILLTDPAAGTILEKQYDFYVPRGSITNEYKLDAK